MFVPSVSGFVAGALLTTAGALHTPLESVDFMMLQSESGVWHDAQTIRPPEDETAGFLSVSEEELRLVSGPDGSEIRPTMMSQLLTNATVSLPSAVSPTGTPEPIWIVFSVATL